MKRVLLLLFAAITLSLQAQELSLVPLPQKVTTYEGCMQLDNKSIVVCYPQTDDNSYTKVIDSFVDEMKVITGVKIKKSYPKKANIAGVSVIKYTKKGDVHMTLHIDPMMCDEEYNLCIKENKIDIATATPAALFYAFQTLKQLLPRNVAAGVADKSIKEWRLPFVDIHDKPRFSWRGFMLDEGRHFYGKEAVKKVLDIMAHYKMNRFHWHLTEDQGWRIEIKKYPELTNTGAWRDSKVLGWGDVKPDGIRYGGYYTQEDIREIVEYAKEHFIEIIPEIDIPGHSQAAVASYPEILACDPKEKHNVWLWQGVSADVINVSNPDAVQFAKDIIDELTELFPYRYIHLGGDECPTHKWERNSECAALLKEIGTQNYRDLQLNFYRQIKDHIAQKPSEKQRELIFWNEILHGNTALLGNDITIMAWIGADAAAQKAVSLGMKTILTPQIPYYINRKQSDRPDEPHSQGYGTETVEAVYNYVPMKNTPEELKSKYLGVQANFWSEWVVTADHLQYLLLPRLAAVAEAAWTQQDRRDYKEFEKRIQCEQLFYNLINVNYGKHIFE